MLEKIEWMKMENEEEGGEMREILKEESSSFREEMNQSIQKYHLFSCCIY